jgi:hypothetical protein
MRLGLLNAAELHNALSELSTTSSTILTVLVHCSRPRTTSATFFGHSFRHESKDYQIREKSAYKKGGKQPYIWAQGSELKCKQN